MKPSAIAVVRTSTPAEISSVAESSGVACGIEVSIPSRLTSLANPPVLLGLGVLFPHLTAALADIW